MIYNNYAVVPLTDWKGICAAAREKRGSDNLYTSSELLSALNAIKTSREITGKLIDGSSTRVEEDEIGNIKTIRRYAFYGLENLTYIELPVSVTKIESNAFGGCKNLRDVYYAGSVFDWEKIEISDGNGYLLNANIHFGVSAEGSEYTRIGAISTAFRYCAHVDFLNFNNYGFGDAYRDDSSGSSVIVTPIVDNYTAANFKVDDVVGVRAVLILSGWALINGGQDKYYWSVNGHTWHEITRATYGTASGAQANAAMAKGLNSILPENGTFKDAIIDLTAYRGQTIPKIYVAVQSLVPVDNKAQLCHFFTFTNCKIPE